MRRICATLFALAIFAPGGTALGQAAPQFSSEQDVRQWAYRSILDQQAASTITSGTGAAQSYVGKSNNYAGITETKVLAACVDWAKSNRTRVWFTGSASNYTPYSMRMQELRDGALQGCSKLESHGCRCQLVDESNRNVLKVPDDFIKRMLAGK